MEVESIMVKKIILVTIAHSCKGRGKDCLFEHGIKVEIERAISLLHGESRVVSVVYYERFWKSKMIT